MSKERWSGSFWCYEVSTLGRVRNKRTGRVLKPTLSRGYEKVTLCWNGERKNAQVHRLVLMAFRHLGDGLECNHINGVKNDNRLENLEWVTCSQNHHHAVRLGLKRQKANQKLSWEQIKDILKFNDTAKASAAKHGVTNKHVGAIRYGKRFDWLRSKHG